MEIKNNVFIITGGASGLGAATARMIVDNGGKVVLADVQVEAGEKLGGGNAVRRCQEEAGRRHLLSSALTPGSGFPSSHSRKAPPAVEM